MPVEYNVEEKSSTKDQLVGVLVLVGICVLLLYVVFKVSRRRRKK